MQGAAAEDHGFHYGSAVADMQKVKSGERETTKAVVSSAEHEVPFDPEFPDDVYPTEEELRTLERHPDSLPLNVYLIGLVELCERLSYYGCSAVYTNFIQQPLPTGSTTGAIVDGEQPGALGRGQRASTGLTTFNSFWNYVTPLFGGWLADAKWGRYNTILIGIAFAITGHVVLIISALPPVIKDPDAAMGVFALAIVIIGIGTGGFKPNVSPMIAEQYKRRHIVVRTTRRGKKYLIDPTLTHARIYMYFYGLINVGVIVGQVGMVYAERRVGFWLAYTIPTLVFCFCPIIMVVARKRYARTPPQGSVLGKSLRVVGLALKGTFSWNPMKMYRTWCGDEMWEKAKPSNMAVVPAKVTWDDAWVEQVRRGCAACVVFLPFPIYWIAYNQIFNNLLSQAATMDLNGTPNDLLQNLDPIAILILIPLFDLVVYPFFRRVGIRHTPIRKMTWGFFAATLAMVSAAILQHYIYNTNECGYYVSTCDGVHSSINVWAQTPEYVLVGMSEVFASITGLEYAFTKAPTNMRSLVTSVWLFMTAIGNAITEAFVALSSDPLLVWNYGVVAVMCFCFGVAFWFVFRKLDRQEENMNALKEGKVLSAKEIATQHVSPATGSVGGGATKQDFDGDGEKRT